MGNRIVPRCSCCERDSEQALSEVIDKGSMKAQELPLNSPMISIDLNDRKVVVGIIFLQSCFRRMLQRKLFLDDLIKAEDRFDKNIKAFGGNVTAQEMKERTEFINGLERDKIGSRFELSKDELQMYPLTFIKGPIKLKDNSIYEGSWSYEGEKHGHGVLYQEDGSKIEGTWRHDYIDGRGRFIDSKGNYFEGKWKKGRVEGEGRYVLANGSKYEGQWKNDQQEGFGKESFLDGSNYEGFYQNGKKEGEGTFTWINGSCYNGVFSESSMKGKGLFKWRDGRQYKGEWQHNQLNGFGTFLWPNRKWYRGEYKNNQKEGKGTYYWSDKTYYKGFWLNNNQHGEGEFYCDGTVTKGLFRFGKLIKCSSQDVNGINTQEQIQKESSHRNDVKENPVSQPFLFE